MKQKKDLKIQGSGHFSKNQRKETESVVMMMRKVKEDAGHVLEVQEIEKVSVERIIEEGMISHEGQTIEMTKVDRGIVMMTVVSMRIEDEKNGKITIDQGEIERWMIKEEIGMKGIKKNAHDETENQVARGKLGMKDTRTMTDQDETGMESLGDEAGMRGGEMTGEGREKPHAHDPMIGTGDMTETET